MITRLAGLWQDKPFSFWLLALACLYFGVIALWLSMVDIRSHRLPNRIIFPSYAVAGILLLAALLAAGDPGGALRTVLGGVGLWFFYLLLRLIYPAGMGLGDVKLAFLLGLYLGHLGWTHLLYGTMAAFLLGGLWGAGLILSRRGSGKTRIPFGPFMLSGALGAMLLAAG
ncbi:MAG TPA: prepilin peptidase [Micrococcaceae bacterium]|jgi:leader peptidase (prepilin peptidase)/N-methyltransferase|nr:prepilin peptidase [Micrococcaceae bacterium]